MQAIIIQPMRDDLHYRSVVQQQRSLELHVGDRTFALVNCVRTSWKPPYMIVGRLPLKADWLWKVICCAVCSNGPGVHTTCCLRFHKCLMKHFHAAVLRAMPASDFAG